MLDATGERFLPWMADAAIAYEHLHRYAFVAPLGVGKRVLDLASGEGYGSAFLAAAAHQVIGIDLALDAVRHARVAYAHVENATYLVGSILDIPLRDSSFDLVVCFEALEHVGDHDRLFREVKRVLAPGGRFFVSTPNKRTYAEEARHDNPFHVRELHLDEFRDLCGRHFPTVRYYGQRLAAGSSLWTLDEPSGERVEQYYVRRQDGRFEAATEADREAVYFLAEATDLAAPLAARTSWLIDCSGALVTQYAERALRDHSEIQRLATDVQAARRECETARTTLEDLRTSRAYRLVEWIRRAYHVLCPPGSRRRRAAEAVLRAIGARH
jgi:SAM-dependent methyltransferase